MPDYRNEDGKAVYQITSQNYGEYSIIGYAKTMEEARQWKRIAYERWGNAQIRERFDWVIER